MAPTWCLTVLCLVIAATDIALGSDPKTLKVTTVLTEPFARNVSQPDSTVELEGYIIDLLDDMEKDPDMAESNITFHVTPVKDGKYGSYDARSREWDGMIKELKDGTADLAAAPLTQNDDRKDVVQFLDPPFMTFDLAMLMKKDHQSSDVETISDLNIQETKYNYGFVADGATYRYFERSPYTYMQPYHGMDLPQNVEEGVQRVRESTKSQPYVFIGEQQMLEYHASQKPCDLVVLKGNATTGKYHLAVQNNYNQNIVNMLKGALGKLNETGRLDELYNKWWKERSQCQEPSSSTVIGSGVAILVSMLLAVLLRVYGE